ncbi:hypothetical protein CRG98_021716 [Punica granatum]|uniref:Uncharacterized protein n=1 Tax=Punica granatum TaxID=22663 RepID=A0A2I0JNK0_PUNGR|nr:hypothetical protein CRG98_021716 [Punica granatum]
MRGRSPKAVNAGPGPKSSKCRTEARCGVEAQKWGRSPMKGQSPKVGSEPDAGPKPNVGPEPNAVNAGLEPDVGAKPDVGPEPNAVNAGSIGMCKKCESKDAWGHAEGCASDHAVTLSVRKKLVLVNFAWEASKRIEPEPTNYDPSGVAKLYGPECGLSSGPACALLDRAAWGRSTFPWGRVTDTHERMSRHLSFYDPKVKGG